jgi:hypothetical protein
MSRPTTLPEQATSHAAEQAQDHLPTQLPPVPPTAPTEVTLPDAASHMSDVAVSNLPDWVALFPSAQTLSEPAHTNEHQPTELPPTPPGRWRFPLPRLTTYRTSPLRTFPIGSSYRGGRTGGSAGTAVLIGHNPAVHRECGLRFMGV